MKTDIVVFLGQSNMQGQAECLSECEAVENAYEYRYLTDTLVPLRNPVGEDIRTDMTAGYTDVHGEDIEKWLRDHHFGAAVDGHTNMVPAFARAYGKQTGCPLVAVHAAKGSTCVGEWIPETPSFGAIVKKTAAAIKKVGRENLGHLYAVWLQGESDALAGTSKEDYMRLLTSLKDGLFSALPMEKFGIIHVGHFAVFATWVNLEHDEALARDEAIRAAQTALCEEDGDFVMVSELTNTLLYGDKKYLNPYVPGHYSALGLETLGNDAGTCLGKLAASSSL